MTYHNPDKKEYEKLVSEGKTLVDFWAGWCGPCRSQAPIAEKLAETTEVKLVKVDVDECGELAMEFGVSSIPTLLLYDNGKIIKKFIGLTPLEELKSAFGIR